MNTPAMRGSSLKRKNNLANRELRSTNTMMIERRIKSEREFDNAVIHHHLTPRRRGSDRIEIPTIPVNLAIARTATSARTPLSILAAR